MARSQDEASATPVFEILFAKVRDAESDPALKAVREMSQGIDELRRLAESITQSERKQVHTYLTA